MRETRKRTLVKSIIYRIFIILTVWLMLVFMGQESEESLIVSVVANIGWTIAYYFYDRIWLKIKWGIEE